MIQCNRFTNAALGVRNEWKKGRRITFSSLSDCEIENGQAETYSIKYVLQGTEHYFIDGKKYSVRQGEFLVVNNRCPVGAMIRSKKAVTGLCIHLEPELLQSVYAAQTFSSQQLLEVEHQRAAVPEIEPMIYAKNECGLGSYLEYVTQHLDSGTAVIHLHSEEFYQTVTGHLINLQNSFEAPHTLATRNSVQQELALRLSKAKEVMDDACTESLSIEAIAQASLLSPSHFFRLFRQAYNISPYQYLLQRKLERAHYTLNQHQQSITATALHCGFADVASFSKAYKKQYGLSPARALQRTP
ncbi:MAG TPA: AraC family transcriptional regulator [Flavisolibacter sp.]|jgi:AraC-like DNA-binding protein|nr:AraC family transcriptional regulator [Flavisolibacter sp.]